MFAQIELIEGLFTSNHISGGIVALLVVYLYIRFVIDKDIKQMKDDVATLFKKTNEFHEFNTEMKLLKRDVDYLKKSTDSQELTMKKINEDIHKIKGSMSAIESYFKQIIEKDK